MDTIIRAIHGPLTFVACLKPCFHIHIGSDKESLALQSIQVRLRMVTSYLSVQLLSWVRGRDGGLSVLRSANVDGRYKDLPLRAIQHADGSTAQEGTI